jgi:hypothetical protein
MSDASVVLDFTHGPMKQYLDLARSAALGYVPLALIAAVALEAVGRAPGVPRNFAAVVWRALVVLFLFWNYERVFGFVITVTDDLAQKVRPDDALGEYHAYLDGFYAAADADAKETWFGGAVFDAAIGVLLFAAKALVFALERLASILTAVFFILGPIALVAGIPRPSPTAFAWFRHFVTVASWPIFSGVLLGVMTAVAKQSAGQTAGNYLAALIAAAVMALCALAAPVLSGWIIGGAVQNLAGLGLASYHRLTHEIAQTPFVRAMGRHRHPDRRSNGSTTPNQTNPRPDGASSEVAPNPPVGTSRLCAIQSDVS